MTKQCTHEDSPNSSQCNKTTREERGKGSLRADGLGDFALLHSFRENRAVPLCLADHARTRLASHLFQMVERRETERRRADWLLQLWSALWLFATHMIEREGDRKMLQWRHPSYNNLH
jgi:hypothetical protein